MSDNAFYWEKAARRQGMSRDAISLRQLRYFVAVVDCGSFTQASRALHVAQSALSHHVNQLEHEFKAELLTRTGRGVTLTAAGARLAVHAREVLAAVERLHRVGDTRSRQHTVRLGLPKTVSGLIAVELLKALESTAPNVILQLSEGMSADLSQWLKGRRLDAAVLFGNQDDGWPHFEPFIEEPLYLVGAPGTFSTGATIPVDALGGFPLVLPSQANALHQLVRDAARRQGVHISVKYELDITTELLKVVSRGDAYTTLAPVAFAPLVVEGKISAARITKPGIKRKWAWVERHQPGGAQSCAEVKREVVRLLRLHTRRRGRAVRKLA